MAGLSVEIVTANDATTFDTKLTAALAADTALTGVTIVPLKEAGAITVAIIRVI